MVKYSTVDRYMIIHKMAPLTYSKSI